MQFLAIFLALESSEMIIIIHSLCVKQLGVT